MKKTNNLSLISTSLLTAGFILGGTFAFSGDANALMAQVIGVGAGAPTPFQVSKIEVFSNVVPELNGITLMGPWLDRLKSLNTELKQATGRDGRTLVLKYTTVKIFDQKNVPYTLKGFSANGSLEVER